MKTTFFILTLVSTLHLGPALRAADGYVAHEWGTFTSVQGADGIQLEWNPLSVSDLPGFVYGTKQRPVPLPIPALLTKSSFTTLQRMETPVIYFYSDKELTVDATVDFPQGIVTEWFPAAKQTVPPTKTARARTGRNVIRWDDVQILPRAKNDPLTALLPSDSSGSHYFAARATDADFLRVSDETAGRRQQVEKFLFYRGVGNFRAPLTVTQSGDGDIIALQNTGKESLKDLFIYTVRNGQGKYLRLANLRAGTNHTVELQPEKNLLPLSDLRAKLGREMREGLVREGLYEAEAAAMVQTWDDSWFGESGTRVLYTLPRAWTDRTLPLTLDPKPREIERVMVGRAELISPAMEWNLMKLVSRYTEAGGDDDARARVIEHTRALGLGRFLEPATRRLIAKMPTREFSKVSHELLMAASKPAPTSKPLAAK